MCWIRLWTGPGFQTDFQFPFSSKEGNKKIIAHLCANPLVFVPTLDPNNVQVNAPHTPVHEKITRVQTFFIDKACSTWNNQDKDKTIAHLKHVIFSSSTSLKPWVEGKLFVQGCLSLHHVYKKHHEEQRWYLLTTSSLQLVVDHWHWGRK